MVVGSRLIGIAVGALLSTALTPQTGFAQRGRPDAGPTEMRIPVRGDSLYARTIGRGPAMIVLHGGPDFDMGYLLPEMDLLRDGHRLIYYDQRGRGRSADHAHPDEVSIESDVADLDAVREHFRLDSPVLIGHSWGAVLALEYALAHPSRVSRLILLDPAPASAADRAILAESYTRQLGPDVDRENRIRDGAAYQAGNPDAVIARYRIHFEHAFAHSWNYETLMARMDSAFRRQGNQGLLTARAINTRLVRETWQRADFDLLPKLATLHIPTVVIIGDRAFIPSEIGEHIADSIPRAKLVKLENCGHFSYLECTSQVRRAIDTFFAKASTHPAAKTVAKRAVKRF